jgi:2-polyprenyl-3-methyl-5-hydroxy-6-metoxy-1,4-benzoquinol methylase
VCKTLVGQAGLTDEESLVHDDATDFYGKRYWLEHQREALGLPDIYARVRQDLPERCVHWLEILVRYRQPPARTLEIGAGHGAYTALLRFAGYDATALDLSEWVAEFARARFRIPYLVGRIEDQELEPSSFDVLIANDVLEHLVDPLTTIGRCVELLKPDGLLVIQTPEAPDDCSFEELVAGQDLFLSHIGRAVGEHLYLFGRKALRMLLVRLGVGEIACEEPVYPYDMLCVASAAGLSPSETDVGDLAMPVPEWPLVLALLDARAALRSSERDRANRLTVIEELAGALRAAGEPGRGLRCRRA